MSIYFKAGVALSLLAIGGTCSGASGSSWSSTRKAEVSDPQYQMTAYTMQVPDGWKFAGTIARDPGCHSSGPGLKYTVLSPDGSSALVQLPGMVWSSTDSASLKKTMESTHCPAIEIDTAAGYLINIALPNLHPDGEVVSVLPPDAEGQAALAAALENERRGYGQHPPQITLDGARVRVQFQREGKPFEEQILAVVGCTTTRFPAIFKQPAYSRRTCTSRGTMIARAPQGQLDALLEHLRKEGMGKTIHADPAWSERLNRDQQAAFQKFQAENNRQFQAGMDHFKQQGEQRLANGRAFQANLKEGTDQAIAADQARQNAIDQSAHATALHSLNQQEFKDPSTGHTIQANDEYNHQWLSSDGSTLIQTNEHGYDPNGQVFPVSQSWTELVPK